MIDSAEDKKIKLPVKFNKFGVEEASQLKDVELVIFRFLLIFFQPLVKIFSFIDFQQHPERL